MASEALLTLFRSRSSSFAERTTSAVLRSTAPKTYYNDLLDMPIYQISQCRINNETVAYFRAIQPRWLSWRRDSLLLEYTSGSCPVGRRVSAAAPRRVHSIDPAMHEIIHKVYLILWFQWEFVTITQPSLVCFSRPSLHQRFFFSSTVS